jgi:hypothetical protein
MLPLSSRSIIFLDTLLVVHSTTSVVGETYSVHGWRVLLFLTRSATTLPQEWEGFSKCSFPGDILRTEACVEYPQQPCKRTLLHIYFCHTLKHVVCTIVPETEAWHWIFLYDSFNQQQAHVSVSGAVLSEIYWPWCAAFWTFVILR